MNFLASKRILALASVVTTLLLATTIAFAPTSAAQATASISNYTWIDADGNGIQDLGEVPVAGVTINLWDDDGAGAPNAVISTTTSDALGLYVFGALAAGTYHVEFVSPVGLMPTFAAQGGDPTTDSDPDPATGLTAPIVLAVGEQNTDIDAGFIPVPVASVSDRVWLDDNGDGIQDALESGFAGVTVNLWDDDGAGAPNAVIATTVTDANGLYLFDTLTPGDYHVEFVAPALHVIAPQDQGGDDTLDSDADPATGIVGPVTLGPNVDDDTVDAGLIALPVGSISDYVWEDADADGIQDAAEIWAAGVTVNLWDDDGAGAPNAIIATTVTDANGLYLFDNLLAATYHVEFVAPFGRSWTSADQGADDTIDSDVNPATGFVPAIVLGAAVDDDTIDAGLLPPLLGSISDFVWDDLNEDGIQDVGEPGVGGVTVNLWSDNGAGAPGAILATEITTAVGFYSFNGVAPATYFVEFVAPPGTGLTLQAQGPNPTDSDPDPLTGLTGPIALPAGFDENRIDAGLVPRGSISDFVWEDTNLNGVQDLGEAGIAGVTVNLWNDDGAGAPGSVIATTATDASGLYSFTLLTAATYHVEFVTPPNRILVTADQGGDDTLDSDPDPMTGFAPALALGAGVDDTTIDAGFSPFAPGTIGDLVWYDLNGDGLQDAAEPGVAGVLVRVWPSDAAGVISAGAVPYTTTTDANGLWSLTLPVGFYRVNPSLPAPAIDFSPVDAGGDTIDSDIAPLGSPEFGFSAVYQLTPGLVETSVDTGLIVSTAIGDRVWSDDNGDGIQTAGELGLAGLTVHLLDAANMVVSTTTTDANGGYLFAGIPAGTYQVEVVLGAAQTFSPVGQGADPALDSDIDPLTGTSASIVVSGGSVLTGIDAGVMSTIGSGDVNCDGLINLVDALYIAQYSVGTRPNDVPCPLGNLNTDIATVNGDVNGDGAVNVGDSLIITQCEVGINNAFCP